MSTETETLDPTPRDWRTESAARQAAFDSLVTQLAESHKLTLEVVFTPFSLSRNREERHPSVNWNWSLSSNKGQALKGAFTQGVAYLKGYEKIPYKSQNTVGAVEAVQQACERGYTFGGLYKLSRVPPTLSDLLASLARDSEVIDYATFEEWAPELGLDPDSREGEKIYRECLRQALWLRNTVGDSALNQLRELAREL